MQIRKLNDNFSICKLKDFSQVDWSSDFCFAGKTDEEFSWVGPTENVPANVLVQDDGWKAFRIEGVLDFSLVGILAKISTLLAENGISIFAVSTYNTDYVLVKAEKFEAALIFLSETGWEVV